MNKILILMALLLTGCSASIGTPPTTTSTTYATPAPATVTRTTYSHSEPATPIESTTTVTESSY